MPITKAAKGREPNWKEWDAQAQKSGLRHTVVCAGGDTYTGHWDNNLKNGKGTYIWKRAGAVYDGDWKDDKRHGYGTYSVIRDGVPFKQFGGGWKNDKRHGYGTFYYSSTEHYEGEWFENKRNGWGRMYYNDGAVYEGRWDNDMRDGEGTLKLKNNNRFEGSWSLDAKNGAGCHYYLDRGQVYEGVWVDNVPKCGEMKDVDRDIAPRPTEYPIPCVQLAEPDMVVNMAKESFSPDD